MSRRRVRARRGSIPASIEIKTAFRAERLEPLRDALEPRGARDVQTRRSVVRASRKRFRGGCASYTAARTTSFATRRDPRPTAA
jgi:hypothetical protein